MSACNFSHSTARLPPYPRRGSHSEDLGVDIVFNWDHFFPLYGDPTASTSSAGRCSARGPSRRRGSRSARWSPATRYRNPELLADMARTVDHISGGRLILGIGVGLVREGLRRVRLRVRHRRRPAGRPRPTRCRASSPGWAKLNPPPTREIPILIGGGGERKTLRLVAEHADIWHGFADRNTYPRKSEILGCGTAPTVGRDPAEIERSAGRPGQRRPRGLARRCRCPGRPRRHAAHRRRQRARL